jgi:hypothetical protein
MCHGRTTYLCYQTSEDVPWSDDICYQTSEDVPEIGECSLRHAINCAPTRAGTSVHLYNIYIVIGAKAKISGTNQSRIRPGNKKGHVLVTVGGHESPVGRKFVQVKYSWCVLATRRGHMLPKRRMHVLATGLGGLPTLLRIDFQTTGQ